MNESPSNATGARAPRAPARRFTLLGVPAPGGVDGEPELLRDPTTGLPSFVDPEDDQSETFIGLGSALGWDARKARAVHVGSGDPISALLERSTRLTPLVHFETGYTKAADHSTNEAPTALSAVEFEGDRAALLPTPTAGLTIGYALDMCLVL